MKTQALFPRGVWSIFGLQPSSLLCLLLCFSQQPAFADIWGYVDQAGVAHFAVERVDARYEIYFQGGESFDTAAGVKSAGEAPMTAEQAAAAARVRVFFEISPGHRVVKHQLHQAAKVDRLDYELLQALIATESGFNASAVSPKGAIGLMQLMPATAARFGVTSDAKVTVEKKLVDPGINVNTGSRYLRYLINLFPGQLELALAAYNAGEGAVQRAGNKIPNFKETQNYVKTVMQLYTVLKPPGQLTAPFEAPTRVRMEMKGGALNRGNMIPSVRAMIPNPNTKTETD